MINRLLSRFLFLDYFKIYALYIAAFMPFFLISATAFAQQNNLFTAYTVADGLAQSSVWDIIQDKNGFLWVGTSDGLCRFDGYTFKVYKNDPKAISSINSAKDNRFFLDKRQQLWIASAKGISLYDDVHDNFINIYTYNGSTPELQTENEVYGEYGGFIWGGLNGYGFIKIEVNTHRCSQVKLAGGTDISSYLNWRKGFIEDGCIFGNNSNGFFKYDIAANKIVQLNTGLDANVINLNKSEALTSTATRLFIINKATLQVSSFPLSLSGSPQQVGGVIKANGSEVILGTTGGMHYVNLQSKKVVNEVNDLNSDQKGSYSYVQCFFADRSGNLWIGTNGDGLHKLTYPFKKFKLYKPTNGKSGIVKSIYAEQGKLYNGYFDNGFDVFSIAPPLANNIDVSKFGKGLRNSVYGIAPISADKLLVYVNSITASGVYQYDVKTKKAADITLMIKKALPGHSSFTTDEFVFAQNKGTELTGGWNEYLFSINYSNGSQVIKLAGFIEKERISCIFKDTGNSFWVGTYNGLYLIKDKHTLNINLGKKLLVKTINQDADGNIWAGTVEGLYVIGKNGKIKHLYTETNGLPNQFIYGILKDDHNDMWFSTNKGLGRYRWNDNKFEFFTDADGLQSNEFDSGAYFKAADGQLFFGGIKGTNSFYPDDIRRNPNSPKVNVTGIKLFDKNLKNSHAYWNVRELRMPYTDNSLSFDFTLPEYTDPLKNIYSYTMEGVDTHWTEGANNHYARYAGLQPGHYVFKVKAANNDGIWGQATVLAIDIIPPFWQRPWFIFLEISFFVAIIVAAVFLLQRGAFKRKLRVFELQQKIQSERERISRDLHDNIGTQLSLIHKNIREVANPSTKITNADRSKRLATAQQSSAEVIDVLRETIWALNKPEISLEEFADKLKRFIQRNLASSPGLSMKFKEIDENKSVMLSPIEALNLFRICQEGITNTLKYAMASLLNVSVQADKGKYTICIMDNGTGFDPDVIDSGVHYGLENMKFRANEILCNFSIETIPGKGTTINLAKR